MKEAEKYLKICILRCLDSKAFRGIIDVTKLEVEAFAMRMEDMTTRDIANKLGKSPAWAQNRSESVKRKLGNPRVTAMLDKMATGQTPLGMLVSSRLHGICKRAEIHTLPALAAYVYSRGGPAKVKLRGMGEGTREELIQLMTKYGYEIPD